MTDQQFIFLILGTIVFFVIFFSVRRPSKRPTALNMKTKHVVTDAIRMEGSKRVSADLITKINSNDFKEAQNLGCHFVFEGRRYEAFQVLALPIGSSSSEIQKAYQRKINSELGQNHRLIELAYQKLLES